MDVAGSCVEEGVETDVFDIAEILTLLMPSELFMKKNAEYHNDNRMLWINIST